MYNIQKAVSRLDYAPKLKEIEITDIQQGLGVFTPKPDKSVSFDKLKATLKSAGYVLDSAEMTAKGTLTRTDKGWAIVIESSKQRISLEGPDVDRVLARATEGSTVELTGDWKTVGSGTTAYEVLSPVANKASARMNDEAPLLFGARFENASFVKEDYSERSMPTAMTLTGAAAAPIRVTSPGLTVYKGGAFTPRLYLIKQHVGTLDVDRQVVNLSVSYTPSPRLQLEIEAPFSRTTFDDDVTSGSGLGVGNVTTWAKYRFFRTVKTYGDRQAAARFGLELPTGKKDAPRETQINVPAFVRQQLTPISGGLSPHFDIAYSQAGGRVIFGGNAEGIVRTKRDGFRMGHELRLNTDLEYVLLPRDYKKPGGELFAILETTFVYRGTGRLDGLPVLGSTATEYYLAPGLQYAARPRFVVEGSFQFPAVRNIGPMTLRTDRNILLGMKYLF